MGASRFIAIVSPDLSLAFELARNLSPRVEVLHPDAVLLEVSPRWEEEAFRHLGPHRSRGALCFAAASTRSAALVAARTRPGAAVAPGGESDFLAPLPVRWLSTLLQEEAPELLPTLARWGIRTLGELAALPEEELVARLGRAGARWRALARGEDVRPFQSHREEARFEEKEELEWVLDSLEPLSFILGRMLERLCDRLRERGLAAESLRVVLKLADHPDYERVLRPAFPLHDSRVLLSLLRLDLQSHPPPAEIAGVFIAARPVRVRVLQHSLLQPGSPRPAEIARTLGRLKALVGEDNVGTPVLLDTHRPDGVEMRPWEESGRERMRVGTCDSGAVHGGTVPELPFFRLPLALRRVRPPRPMTLDPRQILACAGPWRSSGEWWAGEEREWSREEWDVELVDGTLCRVFWDVRSQSWFLEGVYD